MSKGIVKSGAAQHLIDHESAQQLAMFYTIGAQQAVVDKAS